MKKLWRDLHVAHDMSGFGHMGGFVKGVRHYADRAMLLPANTVYVLKDETEHGLIDEHLAFLRRSDVSLGPSNVVQVAGPDIFAGIMSDRIVLENLQRATMQGSLIQIFCMTKRAESFFVESLINKNRIDSAPLEIANKLNDKVELRRIGEKIGLTHAFLEYVVSDDLAKTLSAVKTFLARSQEEVPFVVVKQVNLAGGDGFLKIMRDDNFEEVLQDYFTIFGNKRVLIEEGHPHKALSIQVAIKEPKSYRIVGWTRQLVRAPQGQHFGNSMVRMALKSQHPLIRLEDRITMETWARLFAEYAHERIVGYRGTIGFDFIQLKRPRKDGRDFFILECNARQTASTYPLAVSHQLEGRGKDEWGISMWNALDTNAQSVGEVLAKLGDDLIFSGTRGVIPFNPRLMTEREPAIGIIAVGSSLQEAGRMGREARSRLLT